MTKGLVWHDPWFFLVLGVSALFVVALIVLERRRSAALRFPLTGLLKQGPRGLAGTWWLPHLLRLSAVCLACVAIARPQIRGARVRDLSVEGIDIVVSLDISTSMNGMDFTPKDRITVAKEVLRKFIEGRTNDRIGLVVFAGEAYTQAPLTLDYHVLGEILDSVRTGLIEDGTAIGNAVGTAINRLCEARSEDEKRDPSKKDTFCKSGAKSKVVILITDGDNNAGNISPLQATAIAKDLGLRIYTILVGKGGMVKFPSGQDFFGNQTFRNVDLSVNPELLQTMAAETGGSFYKATDRKSLESGLNDILDQLEKTKLYQAGGYENYTETYEPLLLAAVIALLLELLLSATRWRSFP
ncbi:MAG: VWA domain-containing protein [Deltaproteobacteria bacterium]|nr:VWA domain-containing protein [Deltaproteobacteria bacterium]